MEKDQLSRKLAVILHADVVDSTSLVQQNEALAHERIRSAFNQLSEYIDSYHGLTREIRGDALLAEFERASDAITSALAFQAANEKANASINDDIKPRLRIGISLGEVVIADDTITGAGVVLAQRVEQLSDPDGVCITAALHEATPRHLPVDLLNLGQQELKGFDDPVNVYKATLSAGQAIPPPEPTVDEGTSLSRWTLATISVVAIIIAISAIAWLKSSTPGMEVQMQDSDASQVEIPSIAVLPFDNLGDDPSQTYFSDGISEDIITDLSQLKNLAVISRNSSFTFRDTSIKVQDIGKDLGAKYLLDGSVRKDGSQIRITAQLIDTGSGHQLWAERYDRELIDMFAVQDDITEKIVSTLSIQLTGDEVRQLANSATNSFEAYDLFLQGQLSADNFNKEGYIQAAEIYRRAISVDPNFARAYGALAVVLTRMVNGGYSDTPGEMKERSLELARKAVSIDSKSPQVQWSLGFVYLYRRQLDEAVKAIERAVLLSPSYADGYALLALIKNNMGEAEEAIQAIEKGMELNPHFSWEYLYNLGRANYALGQYEKAVEYLQQALERNEFPSQPRIFLMASYVQLGQQDDAEWEVDQLGMSHPQFTLSHLKAILPIQDKKLLEKFVSDLTAAGLPE
jgi:adenylate cyclase